MCSLGEQVRSLSGKAGDRPSGPVSLSVLEVVRTAGPLVASSYSNSIAVVIPGVRFVASLGITVELAESRDWSVTVWTR